VAWKPGLERGQTLKPGDAPATLIPTSGRQRLVAWCTAPALGSGRIAVGNRVQLELAAYPPAEYGYLEGRVHSMARLPEADAEGKPQYRVLVALPDTLRSSYGKPIPFRQNMSATARIVTRERRVLERLLGRLWEWKDKI
jgi:hypothetical protein